MIFENACTLAGLLKSLEGTVSLKSTSAYYKLPERLVQIRDHGLVWLVG
jgi:hypothetical protein